MTTDQASQSLQILVVFASCLLILAGGCVVLFGLQMRNTVWTKYPLSSTPSVSEILAYFTVVAVQVIRPAVATADKSALTLAFQIISSIALLLNVYNLHARLPFWHIQTNRLYLVLFACVVAFKIVLELADGNAKTNTTALICFAVVQLVARVVSNVILYTSKVRVFEKNMTGFKRQLGITLLQKYLFQETPNEGDRAEKDLYAYYQGQWHKFVGGLDLPESEVKGRETRLLIEYLTKLNTNDSTVLKLILLL
jgi:hypothetical protein